MGKRGQMSLEHVLLVSAVIVFVAIVALATRYVVTAGGSNTGTSGNLLATLKASYAEAPTAIEMPIYENPTAITPICTPNTVCGTKTGGQNSTCPDGYGVTPCIMTCDRICSNDGGTCNDCDEYECEALCMPPTPTCAISAAPDEGTGQFTSTITATFSNLLPGTTTAAIKCTASDSGESVSIVGDIASRDCVYPEVGIITAYAASADAGGANCQVTVTDNPEPPCVGVQEVRVTNSTLVANQPFSVYAKFTNCADNSAIFGGKRVLFYPTNMRRYGFRFGQLYNDANRNDIYSTGPAGAYTLALSADALSNTAISLLADPAAVALVDVDNDNRHEYIQGMVSSPHVRQMETTGAVAWGLNNQYSGCRNILAGDFDGDGKEDSGVLCSNNFTAYKASGAATPTRLWSVQNFSGNISYNGNIYEFDVAKMDCEGTAQVAIPFGDGGPWISNVGIAVYNATNGTLLYRHNMTGMGEPRAITHLDASGDGCYDTWAMLTVGTSGSLLWLVNKSGIISTTVIPEGLLNEIASGDLNGDGINNEIVFVASGGDYSIRARTIDQFGAMTSLWQYAHSTLRWNKSSGGSGTSNNMRVADLDGDGLSEVVYVGNGGVVTILNGSGGVPIWYNGSYSVGTPAGSTALKSGKSPGMDISVNSSDNSTLIGWGDGTDLTGYGFNAGNLYVFEYQPCKISINGNPLVAMDWDRNERKWAYRNAAGMPAGTYGYAVYCDGNFSGLGKSEQSGSLTFGAAVASCPAPPYGGPGLLAVTLTSPQNGATSQPTTINFTATVYNGSISDAFIKNMSLWTDVSGTFTLSKTLYPEAPENQTIDENNFLNMSGNNLYFRMNNDLNYGENNAYVYDFSGKNHFGLPQGGATPAMSDGIFGGGYYFDGNGDYIQVADNDLWSPVVQRNMTMSIWARVKPKEVNFGTGGEGGPGGYMMSKMTYEWAIENDRNTLIAFTIWNTGSSNYVFCTKAYNVNDSVWHNYAMTFQDRINLIGYIDGEEVCRSTSFSGTIVSNRPDTLNIGYRDASNYFNGTLDEAMVFNRSLNSTEMLSFYQRSKTYFANFSVGGITGNGAGYIWNVQTYDNNSAQNWGLCNYTVHVGS
ncbi:MAG: LamG-like jellyroll fold domain-containing protein [Candidatus Micrarchaeota archaeon]